MTMEKQFVSRKQFYYLLKFNFIYRIAFIFFTAIAVFLNGCSRVWNSEPHIAYNREKHRIRFEIPADWKVTRSTSSMLIARDPGAHMKIGIWRGRRKNVAGIAEDKFKHYRAIRRKEIPRRATPVSVDRMAVIVSVKTDDTQKQMPLNFYFQQHPR